jgi:hypothetical protein
MNYSQNDEQIVILGVFEGITNGRLLDLGAFDGTNFSNSRALMELGWEGVLVEPSPWPFSALVKLYWDNPKATLINGFIVPRRHANVVRPQLLEYLATPDAISCQEESTAAIWGRQNFRKVWTNPIPFNLIPQGPYDFVTIDIEDGTMPLVIDFIHGSRILHDAKLVVLEHTAGGVSCRKEMLAAMGAIGKKVIHETPENYLFT